MIALSGIAIQAQIYESDASLVYRGIRLHDNLPIVVKVLKQDYPTAAELTRYRQEYAITHSLALEGVVKAYDQKNYQHTLAILFEDFGGRSLEQWMQDLPASYCPMPLSTFLQLAIALTDTVGKIHAANIIHKDINPSNIVLNPNTGVVKIIDFGIATRLSRTHAAFSSPDILEGTLAYLSPEQTGRMNRLLDYRTDFYSLGITFYRLLTGRLPFTTRDALELVHCHIAKQPAPPHVVNPAVPTTISAIVMKLLAKNAEERYQSAWGIKADLEACLHQLETNEEIAAFPVGTLDRSNKFQIPQQLYGRKAELDALMSAFERVSKGYAAEMVLVEGYAGIGKSALIQELYKPVTAKRGYFIAGKFDQFQRNIPYSAVVDAFQSLVQQLLSESDAQLRQWRDRLIATLGTNGQVIIDVIPEVELIIGKQPPVSEVGATETQNRFNLTFQKFIRVFCSRQHPLVIFLDDLQWVDSATLKLIELMLNDRETDYLFLIGAYRNDEVSATHPFAIALEKLKQGGAIIDQITLSPLEQEPVTQMIAETLQTDGASVEHLAKLVLRKTGGNPFFLNEFLKTLYTERLITFDVEDLCWQWDIAQIESRGITENVVELMISKLKKLPESTQHVLQLAACVGAEFDLTTLSIICEKSPSAIFSDLVTAIDSSLILPISELNESLLIQKYKFLHDRIQQAAYTLIADDQKPAVHLRIGRNLLQRASTDNLFEIVDHLNLGCGLVNDQSERDQIAQLNLGAGKKAKVAIAYSAALQYFSIGLEQLSTDCWQSQYALSLALHEEAAEVAYLCGVFDQVERWAAVVLQQATSILDRVKAYEVKIHTLIAQFRQLDTVRLGLQVLEQLNMTLPESPSQAEIEQTFSKTHALLNGRPIEALLDLPPMTDAYALACTRILSSMLPAAYGATPTLMLLIVSEQVNLSIQHGNSALSAYPYAMYGGILSSVLQDIERAYQFGALALSLVERFKLQGIKGKTLFAVALFSIHGKQHLKQSLPVFQDAYMSCLEAGDTEYMSYAGYCEGLYAYAAGVELTQLERAIATYDAAIAPLNHPTVLQSNQVTWQAVLNLMGQATDPCRLQGKACHEDEYLAICTASNNYSGFYYLYIQKLILCYLFNDQAQALNCATHAEQYSASASGAFYVWVLYFYDSLTRLAIYPSVSQSEQEQILLRVADQQEKLQHWADHAPMNFQHKIDLIKAETARVLNQILEAETYYEQAIRGANEHEYIQEEALAYELAAQFYLARGMEKIAQTYLKEAHYCYGRWGATAKVLHLETRYPQFLSSTSSRATHTFHATTSSSRSSESLDLTAMMKASQTIASQIMLDQLLASLIKILLESTGAQSGFLILDKAGEWVIEASGVVAADGDDDGTIDVLQSLPVRDQIPMAVFSYVSRMRESVVIRDAIAENKFVHDPYIQAHQSKSILCTPLINQGELVGIVYLENNLATGAFTQQRVDVVQLLSGQAAIALTNAKLYAEVQERENRLTQFIDAMPVGVTVLDTNGRICYVNQMTYELSGITDIPEVLTERELAQAHVYQAGTDQFYPQEQLPILRSLAGETVHVDDMEFRRPDKTIPLSVSSTPIFDETGKVVYAIATFQDISDRKQAENLLADYNRTLEQQVTERTLRLKQLSDQLLEQNTRLANEVEERKRVEAALRQKESMNRAVISTIPDLFIWMDRQGNYLGFFAPDGLKLYNPDQERVGANIYDVLPPEVADERMTYVRRALQTGELQVFENKLTIDGAIHYQETRIAANGEDEVLIIVRDFSAQRNAALRERKHVQEASILEERNRMAREIHDTLAQAFTGIIVHLEAAALKATEDPRTAQIFIQTGIDSARFGLAEARRSVRALRPKLLEEGDLYSAFNHLALQLFSSSTKIICELAGEAYPLPPEVENNLLRIGQEALTNAAKYAKASEIQINLVYESTQCILSIKDNGRGFEINHGSVNNGFGLLGMTERAERIQAHLTIQSTLGAGTEVVVSINREPSHE